MAGLGAAQLLDKAGFNYEILEGQDRIGGRIQTVTRDSQKNLNLNKAKTDGPIENSLICFDLGAQWIHGRGPGACDAPHWVGQKNPLQKIVEDYNIKTIPCWDGDRMLDKQELYWYKGGKALGINVHDLMIEMEDTLEDLQLSNDPILDGKSVAEVLRLKFTPET